MSESPAPVPPPAAFAVVGIGASAGGLPAFETFFSALPDDAPTGIAFVIVQHLAPDAPSLLAPLLQRHTALAVREAADGVVAEPETVYIIPPNRDLAFDGDVLRLSAREEGHGRHLTVDHFFRSLAHAHRERAVAIVMSGSGSDGAAGVREVKVEGGLVIAQSPETTEYDGMPRSAIGTGHVDFVLPPQEMPARLLAFARQLSVASLREPQPPPARTLAKLCAMLLAQTGHDAGQYKESTLLRRMERRMTLHQIASAEDYLRHVRDHPAELDALFRDMMIGVTGFFRDAEAFAVLEEQVIPTLVASRAPGATLRVWVCGCSTGEEAYSIAILLQEHLLATQSSVRFQVFATDVDRRAIESARSGVFPASAAADVPPARLARWFVHDPHAGTYRIHKQIRDLLVFSEQDVVRDPPFSRLDVVSCRNLLIYLTSDAQRRLGDLFHYALVPGGVLFLGASETVGEHARRFKVIDRKWKLYQRLPASASAPRPAIPPAVPALAPGAVPRSPNAGARDEPASLRQLTEQALLAHYAHAGVLVDERGQIVHIVGRTGKFLEPARGDATMSIVSMAREGLRRELSVALHRAAASHEPVAFSGLRVGTDGQAILANLVVRPVDGGRPGAAPAFYLVVLEEAPPVDTDRADGPGGDGDHRNDRIAELERDLRTKDEYLQTTLEEMETTNEELKSTNEELQSVNEELQSTNEELETSKEELQSVNEELSTVNAELQEKVAELSRANNDMNNLLAGTGVGTVFVDHELRIARFTPAATQVIHLIAGDIGRPLAHVATNLVGYDRLVDDVRAVLDTLVPREAEVQVRGGAWFLMRVRPYRTIDNLIEGAVVTLVEISERKRAEQALQQSQARLETFIQQAYAGVGEVDLQGRLTFANDRLCQMLGQRRDELLQRRLHDLTEPQDVPVLAGHVAALAAGGPEAQCDLRFVRIDGSRVHTHNRISAIREGDGGVRSLIVVSVDLPPS